MLCLRFVGEEPAFLHRLFRRQLKKVQVYMCICMTVMCPCQLEVMAVFLSVPGQCMVGSKCSF
jgi:hypothetical protein